MRVFQDTVAVVTGAASGIGRAMAERCAKEGMKVVLADIETAALSQAEAQLRASGAEILAVQTDVSKASDVEALAFKTLEVFGRVDMLFNNAGVGAGSSTWESSLADWEWVLGVNLWGVIHGLHYFLPKMLAQESEGHIVNTASVAGLLAYHPVAPYQVSKHAVVALSENLYYTLKQRGARVKVSVLCPGWVNTNIMDAGRNRPVELQNEPVSIPLTAEVEAVIQGMRQAALTGMAPDMVADRVIEGIRDERFYILTHPEFTPTIQARMEYLVKGFNPPDF